MKQYRRDELVWGNLTQEQARSHKGKTFLQFKDFELTFDEFEELTNRAANGFAAQGITRGDKVAIMLPNSPEILYSIFGLSKLGAVAVPINTAYKGDLLEHTLKSSDASMCVVEEEWLDRLALVEAHLPKLQRVIARSPSAARPTGVKKPTLNFRILLDAPSHVPDVHVHYGEPQALMYTSGTTGPSKGVEVAQAHGPTTSLGFILATGLTENDVLLDPMPLFHGIGLWQGVMSTLLVGGRIAITERFSASQWWELVRKYKATVGIGIFSVVPILLSQPPSSRDKEHTLRAFYLGPSSLDQTLHERFGVRSIEIYGMTEVGICTASPYGQLRPGSCGKAIDDTYEVKIFDEFDREMPAGQPGEFCIRPKVPFAVTTGYYNFDAATVKAYRNMWFHSGDRGYMDKDGFFYFIDRQKDALRRRGENVSSFEVERVINAHPAVLESAIIAVPAELGEDEIKACVVLHPGAHLDAAELLDFCQPRMPHFMVPRFVEFMPSLPKTPTEKVEKHKLRQEGKQGITPQTWDRERVGYRVKRD